MHNHLTPADKRTVLERLSVFKSGFLAEAAAPVCTGDGISAEVVEAAVEALASEGVLVRRELQTGSIRYDWTAQRRGKQSQDRDALQRKAEWYVEYLTAIRPRLAESDQVKWLDQIELDHEDIKATIEWTLDSSPDPNTPIALCIACFRFWYVRGHLKSGSELTLEAVNRIPMRQDRNKLRALNNAALLLEATGDHQRSSYALRNALTLARALGDAGAEAAVLGNLATNARDLMDYQSAEAYHLESVTMLRTLGDKTRLLPAVFNYAATRLDFNITDGVQDLLDEAEELASAGGDEWMMAFISDNRAHLAELEGNYDKAKAYYRDSLSRYSALKDAKGVSRILKCLAELAVTGHMFDRAATLFGAAEFARESCHAQVPPIESEKAIVAMTNARGALGDDAFRRAYGIGHTMKLEEAVKYASAYG